MEEQSSVKEIKTVIRTGEGVDIEKRCREEVEKHLRIGGERREVVIRQVISAVSRQQDVTSEMIHAEFIRQI